MDRLLVALAASSVLLVAAPASAEPILSPSAHGLLVIAGGEVAGGGAGTLMFGYNTEHEPILMIPHVAGSFGYYGGSFSGIYARGLAGMKLGTTWGAEWGANFRTGYGMYQLGAAGMETTLHGMAWQFGPWFDHRINRDVSVGVELLYDLFHAPKTSSTGHAVLLGISFGFGL